MYLKIIADNPGAEIEDVFALIYVNRARNSEVFGFQNSLFSVFPLDAILENTEGDFPIFVFMIMCLESQKFRRDAGISLGATNSILTVIREECRKKIPRAIKFDNNFYLSKGQEFAGWVASL